MEAKKRGMGTPYFAKLFETLSQSDRKVRLVVLAGAAGIFLILASSFWPSGAGAQSPSAAQGGTAVLSSDQYTQATEQRLTEILSSIEGVGRVKVMVTLESGTQAVFAKNEKSSTDTVMNYESQTVSKVQEKDNSEESYILVDTSAGKRQPLMVTELSPVVQGVVVVCDGAKDARVAERVTTAVMTSLGISSLKVCVVQLAS